MMQMCVLGVIIRKDVPADGILEIDLTGLRSGVGFILPGIAQKDCIGNNVAFPPSLGCTDPSMSLVEQFDIKVDKEKKKQKGKQITCAFSPQTFIGSIKVRVTTLVLPCETKLVFFILIILFVGFFNINDNVISF